ncbi:MAG: Rpn family recombination-promoting nuclease/putative transposase [Acidobacteria bacterium]|nr:Rpn family recombination-promoting nuclease/putative transposase [Acidobacteriota bacterium]
MDERHESGYRLLFSQPRMVRDLLRGFLHEEWIGWLDPGTLERRAVPAAETPPDPLAETLLWRLRWQGGSAAVYLLLRPLAADDRFAAVRLWADRGLLYQHLLHYREDNREARRGRPLPLVLPVVLYGGGSPWSAPRDAFELFQPIPGPLQRHLPRIPYLVFDAAHDALPPAAGEDNLVALLCRLERSRSPQTLDPLLDRLDRLLDAAGDEALWRAWSGFIAHRFPDGTETAPC